MGAKTEILPGASSRSTSLTKASSSSAPALATTAGSCSAVSDAIRDGISVMSCEMMRLSSLMDMERNGFSGVTLLIW